MHFLSGSVYRSPQSRFCNWNHKQSWEESSETVNWNELYSWKDFTSFTHRIHAKSSGCSKSGLGAISGPSGGFWQPLTSVIEITEVCKKKLLFFLRRKIWVNRIVHILIAYLIESNFLITSFISVCNFVLSKPIILGNYILNFNEITWINKGQIKIK